MSPLNLFDPELRAGPLYYTKKVNLSFKKSCGESPIGYPIGLPHSPPNSERADAVVAALGGLLSRAFAMVVRQRASASEPQGPDCPS